MHPNPATKTWDGACVTTHISLPPTQFTTAAAKSQVRSIEAAQLIAAVVAFWPVWFWYCERICDRSDEPLGVVALITVLALSWGRINGVSGKSTIRTAENIPADQFENPISHQSDKRGILPHLTNVLSMIVPLLLVLLYCCLFQQTPIVVQSIVAVTVVGICLIRSGASVPLAGDWALLLLSLPVVASLNFYFGYPLRILASHLASVLLNLGGLAVRVQGADIFWNDMDVSIDQPCSGIRMLWVAFYLTATLCSTLRLKLRPTIQLLLQSVVAAVVANALRVSSLFYLESGIIKIEAPWHNIVHSGIGIVAFALTALILTKVAFVISYHGSIASPQRLNSDTARSTPRAQIIAFTLCCGLAATIPFFVGRMQQSVDLQSFKGWPAEFEGRPLREETLSSATARFADQFPGCIAVFASDNRRVIFRWVTQPTRQLHSAETCYRASGYEIKWLPKFQDLEGNGWAAFEATKDSEKLRVRERLFDERGHSWTDVSAWYWSAVLQHSRAPWWSICVIESD